MIPEAILNQILDRVDIVEVIGAHIPLKNSGRNFKANCPFHHEKSPSFMVSPDKQIYHCFGCGVGGNVFGFLMKFEKKDFREVVEDLATSIGIELPKDGIQDSALLQKQSQLQKAVDQALEFFKSHLQSAQGFKALQYLQRRGLSEETIKEFSIGYASESWDALYQSLKNQFSDETLEKAGLVISKREGGFYDRFRSRIMFPIFDEKGRCVAFGGRVLDDSLPKYMNSPESEIYSKSRVLYGLAQARKDIRQVGEVVLVEGYMDFLSLYQAGVRNVVATCGTALTDDQIRLIKRQAGKAYILYDTDSAGEMATERGIELFLMHEVDARVVRLSSGKDPDSFIKEKGAEAFLDELKNALSIFEYKLALLKKNYPENTIESRVKIAGLMVRLISKAKNEILKSAWVESLARELGLSVEAVQKEMAKIRPDGRSGDLKASAIDLAATHEFKSVDSMMLERLVLGLALDSDEFKQHLRELLTIDDFKHPDIQKLMKAVLDAPIMSSAMLMNLFAENGQMSGLIAQAAAELEYAQDKKRIFSDCVFRLQKSRLLRLREGLQRDIQAAENIGDMDQIKELLKTLNELNKREKAIHEKR